MYTDNIKRIDQGSYDFRKYRAFQPIGITNRTWPDKVIDKAPLWCSVDLRDGNQALAQPMSVAKKVKMFKLLVKLGFKEIEIGFPSAAQTEFEFARKLIEENLIPDDVTVQVLTQAREHLIKRSFEALDGVKKAIVHVYNSTSRVQRQQVFASDQDAVADIAVQGARWVKDYAAEYPQTQWTFQYSPESFTSTEIDYAVRVCNDVINVWQPQQGQGVIINLPATVETATPNAFADQIEYMCRSLRQREHLIVSLHTHNDRGCGIAAAELGIMAGADRVEGTLLGNGERTGNMDIVTMAMNLYSQGIDPKLDLHDVAEMIEVVKECTQLPVHPRHPWVGELVYTAFSGSHQDAIRKSIDYHKQHDFKHWEVAYLPINPADLGRRYEEIVRINSQSGKGGVGLVLERDYGYQLPKWMLTEVSRAVQKVTDASGKEISSVEIHDLFKQQFTDIPQDWRLKAYSLHSENQQNKAQFVIEKQNELVELVGHGQGVLEALVNAISRYVGLDISIGAFDEHALTDNTASDALASIAVSVNNVQGVACAIDEDSTNATLQACLSAVGRVMAQQAILSEAV